MPFNSWQEIQRRAESREGRGMAYGKWNDSSDQNKLFLVSLGPDPIIRLSVSSDNRWSRGSPDGGRENDHRTCLAVFAVVHFTRRSEKAARVLSDRSVESQEVEGQV